MSTASVSPQPSGVLFGRKAQLLVARTVTSKQQTATEALDLSEFKFSFRTEQSDVETPNLLVCRIYNLTDSTVRKVVKEYDQISLSAGYENASYGIIYRGSIVQFRQGYENVTDTFLELTCSDGDLGYNFGFVNKTLAPESGWIDVYRECARAMGVQTDKQSLDFLSHTGIIFYRGKSYYGLARGAMRTLANTVGARWSIQNGVLVVIPNLAARAGTAIELGPTTGLVGIPEATPNGVEARSLLNPYLTIGANVSIDQKLITVTAQQGGAVLRPALPLYGAVTRTNLYRILVAEHTGDTRGGEWYTDLTCVALDKTIPTAGKVMGGGL